MKRIYLSVLAIGILISILLLFKKSSPQKETSSIALTPFPTLSKTIQFKEKRSFVFVPYWALHGEIEKTTTPIYFGIGVNEKGINYKDEGYNNLKQFVNFVPKDSSMFLTLRMVDSKTNFLILEDAQLQKKIIEETLKLAKEFSFKGVIVDLELVSLPFNSVTNNINSFISNFNKASQEKKVEFGITLYGDTFYKIRPYDVKYLSEHTQYIFLMSYDFHKASGKPGPNFPLKGKEKYGYDFSLMITDFLNFVPSDKLIVVFGMFGYDWIIEDDNSSLAKSYSLLQMKKRYIDNCFYKDCVVTRDPASEETHVLYTDSQGRNHSVWFEDEESMRKKTEFLHGKNIYSTALWAHSYY